MKDPIFTVTADRGEHQNVLVSLRLAGTRPEIVEGLTTLLAMMVHHITVGSSDQASFTERGYSYGTLLAGLQQNALMRILEGVSRDESDQEAVQHVMQGITDALIDHQKVWKEYLKEISSGISWQ